MGARPDGWEQYPAGYERMYTDVVPKRVADQMAQVPPGGEIVVADSNGSFLNPTVETQLNATFPKTFNPSQFGTVGEAVDSTAAIEAAVAAAYTATGSGVVYIDRPMGFAGVITIPEGVVIRGPQATQPRDDNSTPADYSAGRLIALGDGCQIKFWDSTAVLHDARGGQSSDFVIDGAGHDPAAEGLLYIAHSITRTFANIRVFDSAGIGMTIERSQNTLYMNVVVSRCVGHAGVLDRGAGNNAFLSCHFRACDGYNLYLDDNDGNTGSVTNTFSERTVGNAFIRCNFEGNHPTAGGLKPGLVRVPPGDTHPTRSLVEFDHCAFAGGTVLLEGGRTTIRDSRFNSLDEPSITLEEGAHVAIDESFVELAECVISADGGTADLGRIHPRLGYTPIVGGAGITHGWTRRITPPATVHLDGTVGNGPSTPDSASNPTANMSLMAYVAMPDYTPAAFRTIASIWNSGGTRSWEWGHNTTGVCRFRIRNAADNGNLDSVTPDLELVDGRGYWRAVTFVGDDSGDARVRHFISDIGPEQLPRPDQWVQVDNDTLTGPLTLNDTTEPLWIGSSAAGATTPLTGDVAWFIQTSDVNTDGTPGSTVTAEWKGGQTPHIDQAGRRWAMNGTDWSWADAPYSGK